VSGNGSGGSVVVGRGCLGLTVALLRCPMGWLPMGGLCTLGACVCVVVVVVVVVLGILWGLLVVDVVVRHGCIGLSLIRLVEYVVLGFGRGFVTCCVFDCDV
jgi:hypothetical protein